MKYLNIICVAVIFLCVTGFASLQNSELNEGCNQENNKYEISWIKKTSMPEPLYAHTSAIIGDNIHIIGGRGKETGGNNYHYVYNITNDSWEAKSLFPVNSSNLAAAANRSNIYVIGGNGNPEKNHVYNPVNDTWDELTSMPTPRQHINHSAVTVDGKIYVIGGVEKRSVDGELKFTISDKNEIYDPETDTWTEGTPLPTARQATAVTAIDGKIYVIGGSDKDWNYGGIVEVYDIKNNSWETKTELPDSCFPSGIAVVNNKIYVISGLRRETTIAKVFVYDLALDDWQYVTDTYTGVRQSQMVSYGNKLFVIGGVGPEEMLSNCIEGEVEEVKN